MLLSKVLGIYWSSCKVTPVNWVGGRNYCTKIIPVWLLSTISSPMNLETGFYSSWILTQCFMGSKNDTAICYEYFLHSLRTRFFADTVTLLIHELHVARFNQLLIKYIWKIKFQKFSKSEAWICHMITTIYIAFTLYLQLFILCYIVLIFYCTINNMEIIWSIRKDVLKLYATTMYFI